MESKVYTTQEIREEADYCDSVAKETQDIRKIWFEEGEAVPKCLHRKLCNMLRQAADTRERAENLLEKYKKYELMPGENPAVAGTFLEVLSAHVKHILDGNGLEELK